MGLEVSPMNGLEIIWQIENSMSHITEENSNMKIFNAVCHRGPYLDHFFLLYIWTIFVVRQTYLKQYYLQMTPRVFIHTKI